MPVESFIWLCSYPTLYSDASPKPESDDEGSEVTAEKQITAETAAEIAVETSERDFSDGEKLAVWVWQPGDVVGAREYFVRVSMSWTFTARPNHST